MKQCLVRLVFGLVNLKGTAKDLSFMCCTVNHGNTDDDKRKKGTFSLVYCLSASGCERLECSFLAAVDFLQLIIILRLVFACLQRSVHISRCFLQR